MVGEYQRSFVIESAVLPLYRRRRYVIGLHFAEFCGTVRFESAASGDWRMRVTFDAWFLVEKIEPSSAYKRSRASIHNADIIPRRSLSILVRVKKENSVASSALGFRSRPVVSWKETGSVQREEFRATDTGNKRRCGVPLTYNEPRTERFTHLFLFRYYIRSNSADK